MFLEPFYKYLTSPVLKSKSGLNPNPNFTLLLKQRPPDKGFRGPFTLKAAQVYATSSHSHDTLLHNEHEVHL